MSPSSSAVALHRVTLRSTDIDQLGHVNQAVYHQLLEQGRVRFMLDELGLQGTGWVLARTEIDHRSEIRLSDEEVVIETRLVAVGTTSLRMAARVLTRSGTVAAEAISIVVAFDLEARTKRELVGAERAGLEAAVAGKPAAG